MTTECRVNGVGEDAFLFIPNGEEKILQCRRSSDNELLFELTLEELLQQVPKEMIQAFYRSLVTMSN